MQLILDMAQLNGLICIYELKFSPDLNTNSIFLKEDKRVNNFDSIFE